MQAEDFGMCTNKQYNNTCLLKNDNNNNNIFHLTVQKYILGLNYLVRASDISQKKKQNFVGFSGANSRKNRPISRDFRGKTVKIRWKIGRFLVFFTGKKSKFAEKSADFAGFSRKKVKFRRIFRGKFLEKSADFTGNFVGNFAMKQSVKNSWFRWIFGGKFR